MLQFLLLQFLLHAIIKLDIEMLMAYAPFQMRLTKNTKMEPIDPVVYLILLSGPPIELATKILRRCNFDS